MIIKNNLKNIDKLELLIFDVDGTITRWKSVDSFFSDLFHYYDLDYIDEYKDKLFKAMQNNELTALISGEAPINQYAYFVARELPILNQKKINPLDFVKKQMELEANYTFINDDVRQTLIILSEYFEMCCVSLWYSYQALKKLEKHDLLRYFKGIYGLDNNYIKPTRACLEWVLLRYGLSKSQAIMIGDSQADISVAQSVEIESVLMDYDSISKTDFGADATITEFSDILKMVLK